MEMFIYEGKEKEILLDKALTNLELTEEDILFKIEEQKTGLFKNTSYKLSVIKLSNILDYLKEFLTNLINDMGIKVTFETTIREKCFLIIILY